MANPTWDDGLDVVSPQPSDLFLIQSAYHPREYFRAPGHGITKHVWQAHHYTCDDAKRTIETGYEIIKVSAAAPLCEASKDGTPEREHALRFAAEPQHSVEHPIKYNPPEMMPSKTMDHVGAFKDVAVKHDAGKAPVYQGFLNRFPRAVMAVALVSEYGFRKYGSYDGWEKVPDGLPRYTDAKARHGLLQSIEGPYDETDSGLAHAAQDAWNSFARLEMLIQQGQVEIRRGNEIKDGKPVLGTARNV